VPLTGDAVWGPGNAISVVAAVTANSSYQRIPLTGATAASAILGADDSYGAAVGLLTPKQPLAVFAGTKGLAFNAYGGIGDYNNAISWSHPPRLLRGTDSFEAYPHLAGGPSGLWLANTGGGGHVQLKRYQEDQNGFADLAPPFIVLDLGVGSNANFAAFAQDPTGRLYVSGQTSTGLNVFIGDPPRIQPLGTKKDYGQPYGALGALGDQLIRVADAAGVADSRIAVGPDRSGVVVWTTNRGGDAEEIHLTPIDGRPPYEVKANPHVAFNGSRLDISLRCPARIRCKGTVTFLLPFTKGGSGGRLIGRVPFAVAAGRTVRVPAPIGTKGRALLASKKVKTVTATIVTRVGTSAASSEQQVLTLVRRP
jgi:hypothetical protein